MPDYTPGLEQVRVTASPNIQTEQARFDPQESANRLVSALGADSVQREAAAFAQREQQRKLQEQTAKVDWYVEQFAQDHAGGAVSQAQVSERFPEAVPVIAARVAEGIGQQQGKKQFAAVVDEIAGNDALRLDTNARAAFIAGKRAEMVAQVGAGNDFYGAGMVSGIDRLLSQYEQAWQAQTAKFHEDIQSEQFTDEAFSALSSGQPADALSALDEKFARSSSLNTIERNALVVKAAIDFAFAGDDLEILGKVPPQFLNADSKAALERTKTQITDRRIRDLQHAQFILKTQRDEEERSMKIAILQAVADGKPINLADYRNNPEAFVYAMQMREAPRLNESLSRANAESIRNLILDQGTMGGGDTVQGLIDKLVRNPNLNPSDRKALIEDIPKLLEGRDVMGDEVVRWPISNILGPRLSALESSPMESVRQMVSGTNARSAVMRGYDFEIRRLFRAEFEETGAWPKGRRKLELVDKAVDRATKQLEALTRIGR